MAATLIFDDTFTGADGTIVGHVPDVGFPVPAQWDAYGAYPPVLSGGTLAYNSAAGGSYTSAEVYYYAPSMSYSLPGSSNGWTAIIDVTGLSGAAQTVVRFDGGYGVRVLLSTSSFGVGFNNDDTTVAYGGASSGAATLTVTPALITLSLNGVTVSKDISGAGAGVNISQIEIFCYFPGSAITRLRVSADIAWSGPVVDHHYLARTGSSYTIPEVAYQPYRPAYTTSETFTGYRTTPGTSSTGWTRMYIPVENYSLDDGYLGQTEKLVYIAADNRTTQPTNTVVTTTVVTTHPAQAEVKGSPAVRVDTPPRGWTAFAHSVDPIRGKGVAKWKVADWSSAVAVGLTENLAPTSGYSHLRHGLVFSGATVRNLRTSASYGTFVTGDEYTMTVTDTTVSFAKNGSALGSETSTYLANEVLYLSAVLFVAGDRISDPVLTETAGATSSPQNVTSYARSPSQEAISFEMDGGTSNAVSPKELANSYMSMTVFLPIHSEVRAANQQASSLGVVHVVGTSNVNAPKQNALTFQAAGGQSLARAPVQFAFSYTDFYEDEAYLFDVVGTGITQVGDSTLVIFMMNGVSVGATVASNIALTAFLNAQISVHPTWATSQIMEALMFSIVRTGLVLNGVGPNIVSGDRDTWAVNMDNFGSTSYENYGFNSFAKIGDHYYGADERGIFLLEGDTDAGEPIRASVSFGVQRFSNTEKKTVEQCYIGMSAEGNLFIKIIAEGNEYIYKTRSFSSELQQQRVTPGKGLRTNYVTLELYNENGEDFEVDTVKFVVADMKRRI